MDNSVMQHYRQRFIRFGRRPSDDTPFFSNAIVHWISIIVGVIALSAIVLLVRNIEISQTPIKLQYNVYFGSSVRSSWWSPYILSAMGVFFYLVDIVVAFMLYNARERIAAYALLLGGLFAHMALLVAVTSIILNN